MDLLSIIGVVVAVVAILGGNALEGGHANSLIQLTAFVIVVGGTIGAVMVQTPMKVFTRALKIVQWVVITPQYDAQAQVQTIVNWSQIARKDGLLGLERIAEDIDDTLAKKGLSLLVDGSEPETIRNILEVDILSKENIDLQAARVYEALGGYSPTIGILGAVMGLIHVMHNLADPSKLGNGIATAFVATIYGVGLANIVFLPIANKLRQIIQARTHFHGMLLEGIVSIADGENPRIIESKLYGYIE